MNTLHEIMKPKNWTHETLSDETTSTETLIKRAKNLTVGAETDDIQVMMKKLKDSIDAIMPDNVAKYTA
jgi:hypothetical protein